MRRTALRTGRDAGDVMAVSKLVADLADGGRVRGVVEAAVVGVEHDAGRWPPWLGNRSFSTSAACWDSAPGTRKRLTN